VSKQLLVKFVLFVGTCCIALQCLFCVCSVVERKCKRIVVEKIVVKINNFCHES
jgi:hypothetical protein